MMVVSFSMAYRSFWGGSGRLDTHLDTPPSINRRHPVSCLARMTAGEEPIASAQSYATDRVFGDVVIGFEPGVCGKAGQRGAASDDIAQGLGEFGSCRKLSLSILCPDEERIEQGSDSGAMLQPLGGRGEAGLVFDGVELGDLGNRGFGAGRLRRVPLVDYLPAAVAQAGDVGDRRYRGEPWTGLPRLVQRPE